MALNKDLDTNDWESVNVRVYSLCKHYLLERDHTGSYRPIEPTDEVGEASEIGHRFNEVFHLIILPTRKAYKRLTNSARVKMLDKIKYHLLTHYSD